MELTFCKYEGAGDHFILIDNRLNTFPKENEKLIRKLCDRCFGIGANALVVLENHENDDLAFRMMVFDYEGKEFKMCGNGGRCLVAFAHRLGLINKKATFMAGDGVHAAELSGNVVNLQICDVEVIQIYSGHVFIDTGAPHHIQLVKDLKHFPLLEQGQKISNDLYGEYGSHVNFVEQLNDDTFDVRIYERSIKGEIIACGTASAAVAIAMRETGKTSADKININFLGGKLEVKFDVVENTYRNIFIKGPATFVFEGKIII